MLCLFVPKLQLILACTSHYSDVVMGAIASQITSLMLVYSTVYSGEDQRKHQSSASLAFVRGIHRWPVNSPHKWPVTRKMFPFDDVIMDKENLVSGWHHNMKILSPLVKRFIQFATISEPGFLVLVVTLFPLENMQWTSYKYGHNIC